MINLKAKYDDFEKLLSSWKIVMTQVYQQD